LWGRYSIQYFNSNKCSDEFNDKITDWMITEDDDDDIEDVSNIKHKHKLWTNQDELIM